MDLRITLASLVNRSLASVRRQTSRLANLQEQAATGRRILRPSDAPGETQALISGKADDARIDALLSNLRSARGELNAGVSTLTEAHNLLTRAREIAAEGSHAGNTPAALSSLAAEADRLLDRLLGLANSRHEGRYLFSGTATATAPFAVTATDAQGNPTAVTYQGSTDRGAVTVDRGVTAAVKHPGSEIFQGRDRGPSAYATTTGGGTYDAFQSLMALRDDLRNVHGLTEHDQQLSLSQRLDELERVANGLLQGVATQSVELEALERLELYLEKVQLDVRTRTAEVEAADLGEVVIGLQEQQNLMQLTLAATARMFDQSLLDFLR